MNGILLGVILCVIFLTGFFTASSPDAMADAAQPGAQTTQTAAADSSLVFMPAAVATVTNAAVGLSYKNKGANRLLGRSSKWRTALKTI